MNDGFIRVASATPDIKVADCIYNGEQIMQCIDEVSGESVLTTLQGRMYYYTIDPALAMTKNIPAKDKLECFEGTVVEIEDKGALWNVWVEFDD